MGGKTGSDHLIIKPLLPVSPWFRHKMAEWTDHSGTVPYQAGGDSNVLIIVSEDVQGPDVVPRKAAIELTEGCRKMLESQGITRPEDQSDDLAIAKARYNLDKMYTITGVESGTSRGRLTREKVLQRIKTLMTTSSDKAGGDYSDVYLNR